VDTANASVHAIEASSTASQVVPGTFVGAWSNDSILYCTDCHGNSKSGEAAGPHASAQSPLLKRRYSGIAPSYAGGTCYACHRYDVYYSGDVDLDPATGSRFWNDSQPRRLHRLHTSTNGIACDACHASHGSSLPHLIRTDVGYTHVGAGGGSCGNGCHGGATNSYDGR
jgi:predicted CXXCH cytochrome family protein